MLMADCRRDCKILPRADERRLALLYRETGDQDARQRLILSVLPWCCTYANRKFGWLNTDDRYSAACLAAIEAVDHFDPDKGRLTTYAIWRVRSVVMRGSYRLVHTPLYLESPNGKAMKAAKKLYKQCAAAARHIEGIAQRDERFSCRGMSHTALTDRADALAWIRCQAEEISVQTAEVVKGRLAGETLEEIGARIGLTREQCRQILKKATEKLAEKAIEATSC